MFRKSILGFAFLAKATCQPVFSQNTWTNSSGDGVWHNAANWSENQLSNSSILPTPIPFGQFEIVPSGENAIRGRIEILDNYFLNGNVQSKEVWIESGVNARVQTLSAFDFEKTGQGQLSVTEEIGQFARPASIRIVSGQLLLSSGGDVEYIELEEDTELQIDNEFSLNRLQAKSGASIVIGETATLQIRTLAINERQGNEPVLLEGNGSIEIVQNTHFIVVDSAADVDLIVNSPLIGMQDKLVDFSGGVVQLNNPNNKFRLASLSSGTLLLGHPSAIGTTEKLQLNQIEFIGAAEGHTIELANEIESQIGFTGPGQLILSGTISGSHDLNNTLPLKIIGDQTGGDRGDMSFHGVGDVDFDASISSPFAIAWQSTGTLRLKTNEEQRLDGLSLNTSLQDNAGRIVLDGEINIDGTILVSSNGTFRDSGHDVLANELTITSSRNASKTRLDLSSNYKIREEVLVRDSDLFVQPGSSLSAGSLQSRDLSTIDHATVVDISSNVTVFEANLEGSTVVNTSGDLAVTGDARFSGTTILSGPVKIGTGSFNGATQLDSTLNVNGQLSLAGVVTMNDATIIANTVAIEDDARIIGHGEILGDVSVSPRATIEVTEGGLTVGNPDSLTGFDYEGILDIGPNAMTILNGSVTALGSLTKLERGTLSIPGGLAIRSGNSLAGYGEVSGAISVVAGGVIEALGSLTVGDQSAFDGFFSDGILRTNNNQVTILDTNEAVLGSLSEMGNQDGGGSIIADNGILLERGKNIVGHGIINTPNESERSATIDGSVNGERDGQIEFTGYVKGTGTFSNVSFSGTFAPGNSIGTATVNLSKLEDVSQTEIEVEFFKGSTRSDKIAGKQISLGGALNIQVNGDVRVSLDRGELLTFSIVEGNEIDGEFSSVKFNDNLVVPVNEDMSAFHVGDGLFFELSYSPSGLDITTYMAIIGDANGDKKFDSRDFVWVFESGEYEDARPFNSDWTEGDWNGDGDFSSTDLVAAFQHGNYEQEVLSMVVPEPAMPINLVVLLLLLIARPLHHVPLRALK